MYIISSSARGQTAARPVDEGTVMFHVQTHTHTFGYKLCASVRGFCAAIVCYATYNTRVICTIYSSLNPSFQRARFRSIYFGFFPPPTTTGIPTVFLVPPTARRDVTNNGGPIILYIARHRRRRRNTRIRLTIAVFSFTVRAQLGNVAAVT